MKDEENMYKTDYSAHNKNMQFVHYSYLAVLHFIIFYLEKQKIRAKNSPRNNKFSSERNDPNFIFAK